MVKLQVKRFPDDLYDKLCSLARKEQRSLSQQVIHLLSQALQEPKPLSILELRGLGKECWKEGIEAGRSIEEERQ